jgi:hypothetical protein
VREKRIVTPSHELLVNAGSEPTSARRDSFAWNRIPNLASGIGTVAFIARDNVKMEMGGGLNRCRAFIESDVEPVWMETV